jgi:hypothetical protein
MGQVASIFMFLYRPRSLQFNACLLLHSFTRGTR